MSARLAPPAPLVGVTVDDLDLACLDDLSKFPDGSVAPAQLWEALDAVGADEAVSLSDRDRLELVEAWRRLEAASTARRLEHTAAFALTPVNGSGIGGSVREFADAELALRTRATKYTAARDLTTALRLGDVMPRVGAALRAGQIDLARATAVATAGRSLTESQCHELEEQVLGGAVEQDARAVKAAAARAVLAIDADGAEFRRQRAIADRRVVGLPAEDGMVDLYAQLPGLDWVIVSSAINAAARAVKASGDGRTLDQLRADALVAPFAKALRTGILDGLDPITLGKHRGVAPGVNVHVSLATLAGVNESSGWLDGLGPISAAQARELAADGVWRRILTDPATGAVVDVGTTVYQPPRSMARLVESRDRTCRFPGCWVPAERCDLDHTVPFPAGSTAVDNLGSLCRHHHRLKHELPGTTLTQTADGQFIWTLPTGHYYVDHPSDGDPPGG